MNSQSDSQSQSSPSSRRPGPFGPPILPVIFLLVQYPRRLLVLVLVLVLVFVQVPALVLVVLDFPGWSS
ncbi:hypothetical protein JCM24511_09730 [Saitozyma sp. JCM 24511]|nr:hypothetical protein JCM24511_09730 [Saitozyma sp. JCM 24511]